MYERRPLLPSRASSRSNRFSGGRGHLLPLPKAQIYNAALLISLAGLIGLSAAGIDAPFLTSMAENFDTTPTIIGLTVTVFLTCQGVTAPFWGSLSQAYGRRVVFVPSLLIFGVITLFLNKSGDLKEVLIARSLQGVSIGSVVSVGPGVVADMSAASARPKFMRLHQTALLLGVFTGPLFGSVIGDNRSSSLGLGISSIILTFLFIIFLPESLPRIVGHGYIPQLYLSLYQLMTRDRTISVPQLSTQTGVSEVSGMHTPLVLQREPAPKLLDIPFAEPFRTFRNPSMSVVCLMCSANHAICYALVFSSPRLFVARYSLESSLTTLSYIPSILGCIFGSIFGSLVLDYHEERHRIQLKALAFSSASPIIRRDCYSGLAFFSEQARLQAIPWYSVIQFASLVMYGWMIRHHAPLIVPLVLQAIVAFCSMCTFGNLATLSHDFYPSNPEVNIAIVNLAQSLLSSLIPPLFPCVVRSMGEGWAFVLLAVLFLIVSLSGNLLLRRLSSTRKRAEMNNVAPPTTRRHSTV